MNSRVLPEPCRPVLLAASPLARVEHCAACDCVSVTLGPLTFRLEPASLGALWLVLGEAVSKLDAREHRPHAHRAHSLC